VNLSPRKSRPIWSAHFRLGSVAEDPLALYSGRARSLRHGPKSWSPRLPWHSRSAPRARLTHGVPSIDAGDLGNFLSAPRTMLSCGWHEIRQTQTKLVGYYGGSKGFMAAARSSIQRLSSQGRVLNPPSATFLTIAPKTGWLGMDRTRHEGRRSSRQKTDQGTASGLVDARPRT